MLGHPFPVVTSVCKPNTKMETNPKEGREEHLSMVKIFKSVTFILFVYWFNIINVRVNMMTNAFNTWVTGVVHGDIAKGKNIKERDLW